MSYQVLARRWRPQTFDEVTGQEHVTTALRNAVRSGRVPHAILLTGPRGVGKTTLARILARCLNCDKGPVEIPCGTCPACEAIAAGTSTDVQEVDAASRTSVDDVRELIEAIRYAPSPGKHRIYVVDEVHMLSVPAFNALLKTLEEPPPRSLFVFATTNPEKIPYTVISRCQRYDLRRLSTAQIIERLADIASAEDVEISETSRRAIARESDGSLRDAMTYLDQLIAYGGKQIDDERVAEVLDLVDRRLVLGIIEACIDRDSARALEACARAAESGVDARRLGGELLRSLRDVVVLRLAPDTPGLVEGADAEIAELRELAGRDEPARLRRMFRALLREQEDLTWAPQPFAVLEMAVLRLATLARGDEVTALLARLDALERRLAGEPGSSSGGPGGGSARGDARPRPAPGRRRAEKPAGAAEADAAEPPEADVPPTEPPAPDAPLSLVFDRLRDFVRRADRSLAAALQDADLVERTPDLLRLRFARGFAARRLEARSPALAQLCGRLFGTPQRVVIECAEATSDATGDAPSREEDVRRVRQQTLQHPAIGAMREILGGEILEIRPLGGQR